MAASLGRRRRGIAKNVVFVLFAGDPLQAGGQVIGVQDRKSARLAGQRVKDLLVRAGDLRKLRSDLPRIVHRVIESAAGVDPARAAARSPASASSPSGPSASASTASARTATAATPSTTPTAPTCPARTRATASPT